MTANEYESIRVELIAMHNKNSVTKYEFVKRLEQELKFKVHHIAGVDWFECITPGFKNDFRRDEICVRINQDEVAKIEYKIDYERNNFIEVQPNIFTGMIFCQIRFFYPKAESTIMTRKVPCEVDASPDKQEGISNDGK